MCQLNLIFVKNSKNKKMLKNNEYNYFGEDFKSFSPYVKGFCNCGSFVGSMSEYNGNSYFEMIFHTFYTISTLYFHMSLDPRHLDINNIIVVLLLHISQHSFHFLVLYYLYILILINCCSIF